MSNTELLLDLDDVVGAEDFLDHFAIPYDAAIVQVNRLHIMQRFHDYLRQHPLPATEAAQRDLYVELLTRAYQDFVASDALTERVFKVLKAAVSNEPQQAFVPIEAVQRN